MRKSIVPRVIRLRDAPQYLGMDPNRFNEEVRPHVVEIPIGVHGIAFDRLDLDAWFEEYKDRNGRPGKAIGGKPPWDREFHQGSESVGKSGTSGKQSDVTEFEKALERVASRKPRGT